MTIQLFDVLLMKCSINLSIFGQKIQVCVKVKFCENWIFVQKLDFLISVTLYLCICQNKIAEWKLFDHIY